jgi:pyruvate ferredoxin oxidoreductase delta subunit
MKLTAKPGSTTRNKTGGWRTYRPITDYNKCIGCGMCAKVCPENAVSMVSSKTKPTGVKPKTNYDYCKGCGLCAAECPVKAIKMKLEEK